MTQADRDGLVTLKKAATIRLQAPEINLRRKAIQLFSSILITSNGLSLRFSGR